MHVRSLQRGNGGGRLSAWLLEFLRMHADAVVAIDEAVRRTLPADLTVHVVHNGMQVPAQLPPRSAVDNAPFRVAIVGVLHRSKGVYEFVAAARILRERDVDIRLLVVGENVHTVAGVRGWLLRSLDFARDVRGELEAYVAQNGLQEQVEFTGFVSDIRTVFGRIDAVCFPSHLDAPGRPVFEAALYGLPTVVAMRNPTDDVVVPGRTGLCIDVPTPDAIADAIETLATDRAQAQRMGDEARRMALTRFQSHISAEKMLGIYRRVCGRGAATPTTP